MDTHSIRRSSREREREREKPSSDYQGRVPHASNAVVQDNDEKDQADACEHDEPWQVTHAHQSWNAQRAGSDLIPGVPGRGIRPSAF